SLLPRLPRPPTPTLFPYTTLFRSHAKIFTLAGSTIEDGTLIIRDGKIAAVGVGLDVPAGARVIDAKGLQIYPGIFDSITQMGLRSEEHTSELQSLAYLVCRLLLEK